MNSALIGSTGFVGGALSEQHLYQHTFNSTNIDEIRGREFNLIVCAGVRAEKWRANQEPEADWAGIERLLSCLKDVRAGTFVLISTVDVYAHPENQPDEDSDLTGETNHAYGTNRLRLERWVQEKYRSHLIARLPALFGPGLKKNVLYDLMHDNMVNAINPDARFQWYDLSLLWDDLQVALSSGIELINLTPEPLGTGRIIETRFAGAQTGPPEPGLLYDVQSRHSRLYGSSGPYRMSADESLTRMQKFVDSHRPS